ncbi:DBD_Tnp_Mut domain-containing protein [Cephalotus follicularis]|uniref:DBD_Tnp_Mut domain-containing protein n=1 Tax=Cephalotus follicularis TaxID=3775 RepID=A0A1Q3B194_CEPFO|nr:DBD_Tnp_Mut domain-containing protein [Cephalotus follicularis]
MQNHYQAHTKLLKITGWIDIYMDHTFQSEIQNVDILDPMLMLTDDGTVGTQHVEGSLGIGDDGFSVGFDSDNDNVSVHITTSNGECGSDDLGSDASDSMFRPDNVLDICGDDDDDEVLQANIDPDVKEEYGLNDRDVAPNEVDCDSDEITTPVNSDEERDSNLNDDRLGSLMVPKIGLIFSCAKQVKQVVRTYACLKGYNVRVRQKEKWKIVCTCENNCPWRIYASGSAKAPDDSH